MNQEKIGKFISKKRKENNLTQEQLAEVMGVTDRAVSNWENGKNMPDLSLFKPLCEVLNISINDLMSGEVIDDSDYIHKLEENIVDMVNDLDRKKRWHKKFFIIFCLGFIFLLLFIRLWYFYYEFDVSFDSNVMNCEISDQELNYFVNGQSVLNTYYTIKEIDGKTLYFFHNTVNVYNKSRSNYEYSHSMSRLLDSKEVVFSSFYSIDINSNDDILVYYTDYSFKTIENADNLKMQEIVKNSNLMCSSE